MSDQTRVGGINGHVFLVRVGGPVYEIFQTTGGVWTDVQLAGQCCTSPSFKAPFFSGPASRAFCLVVFPRQGGRRGSVGQIFWQWNLSRRLAPHRLPQGLVASDRDHAAGRFPCEQPTPSRHACRGACRTGQVGGSVSSYVDPKPKRTTSSPDAGQVKWPGALVAAPSMTAAQQRRRDIGFYCPRIYNHRGGAARLMAQRGLFKACEGDPHFPCKACEVFHATLYPYGSAGREVPFDPRKTVPFSRA